MQIEKKKFQEDSLTKPGQKKQQQMMKNNTKMLTNSVLEVHLSTPASDVFDSEEVNACDQDCSKI